MIQKLRDRLTNGKKDNKGFTLVELIVVIVILAILAAILVPSLIGWIDKAKEEQYAIEARSAYLATQTIISEKYANSTNPFTAGNAVDETTREEVKKLSGVDVTAVTVTSYVNASGTNSEKNTIKGMTVTFNPARGGSPVTMELKNGAWAEVKP